MRAVYHKRLSGGEEIRVLLCLINLQHPAPLSPSEVLRIADQKIDSAQAEKPSKWTLSVGTRCFCWHAAIQYKEHLDSIIV